MEPLFTLNQDVIEIIIYFLGYDSSSLFNLRLSCRFLESQSRPLFIRRFFRTRRHILTESNLQTLKEISLDSELALSVERLVIGLHHLNDMSQLKDTCCIASHNRVTPEYPRVREAQKIFAGDGSAKTYLKEILRKTVKCTEIEFSDDDKVWGAKLI